MRRIPLRVLHIASFNRWTGAAAPAFAEAESLRLAGHDAHYLYVGGANLETRLGGLHWSHPDLERRSPLRSLRTLRRLVARIDPQIVHTHLTNDHILAILAVPRRVPVVRTFHSTRTLRSDPGTRVLIARSAGVCVVNPDMSLPRSMQRRPHLVTPPPVDTRQFQPAGSDARETLGIPPTAPVIGFIGKVAAGRGFEDAILAFSHLREERPDARLMIIGKGPHRPALEALVSAMKLESVVHWAGYQERELAACYRAADVMLFTAAGSDEGHRAILEELACGVPVASYPLPGVAALLGPLADRLISADATPQSLAATALDLLNGDGDERSRELAERVRAFDYTASAARLVTFYQTLLES